MNARETRSRALRRTAFGVLAIAGLTLPDSAFSVVTTEPPEVLILRMLALVAMAMLAAIPWANRTGGQARRRMQRWSIPGFVASAIYLISADPLYLILGFCVLSGGALDMWVTRAHIASDSLRLRSARTDSNHED